MAKKAKNKMAVNPPEAAGAPAASSHAAIQSIIPPTPFMQRRRGHVGGRTSSDSQAILGEYLGNGYRGEITPALLRKALEIRNLLDKAHSRDIMARHKIGRVISNCGIR